MQKSPNMKDKNITENKDKALQEWLFLLRVMDEITIRVLDNAFTEIKNGISDKSISIISTDTRLTRYDESIYNYYKHLMSYYSRTVEMYDDNKSSIKNKNIKTIFDGIYSVIISRLKLYDEGYGSSESNLDTNPIEIEKNKIIHNNIKLYSKNFDVLKTKFIKQHLNEFIILARQNFYDKMDYKNALYVAEQIVKIIEDCLAENLYKIYGVSIKNSISNLNDMQLRKVTAYYHDILKEEQEILSSIIKIQITALEQEIEINNSNLEEKTILFNMLQNLREGHQYLGKEINEIMECFVMAERQANTIFAESYEEFLEDLRNLSPMEKVIPLTKFDESKLKYSEKADMFKSSFAQSVRAFLERELNEFAKNKSIYDSKRIIAEQILIADEITKVFKSINEEFSEDSIDDKDFKDIVKGIYETMSIKVETIQDSKKDFLDEVNEVLNSFNKNKIEFTEEDILLTIENAFEIWNEEMLNCPREEEQAMLIIEKIFDDILKCETVFTHHEQINKRYTKVMELIDKKILNYKKDSLLFEISTFEEIMNYSISRLRESENETVKAYVDFMDNRVIMLESILKRNNIELIKPEIHEMFNGKEHEVLLAEKNENFEKGEIIKIMNCGYKQNNVVILRANVIAAK